jgi:hypothetical protein
LARRGTWLLLLLVALAAQLGIVRPAAAGPRSDAGFGVVERGTLPVASARRDPPTAARPSDTPIDPPDADVDGPRRESIPAAQIDVVDPVALVADRGLHRLRGGASPRGPPSFEH